MVKSVRPFGLDEPEQPTFYASHAQFPTNFLMFAVRVQSRPETLIPAARRAIQEIDPEQPVHNIAAMEQMVAGTLASRRLSVLLCAGLALLSVVLSASGLYGLLACHVSRQSRSIGLRMALGAQRRDVFGLVLRRAMVTTGAGLAIGAAAAAAVSRTLSAVLFEVQPFEPAIYAIVTALMLGTTAAASVMPAVRAVRIDPISSVRES